MSEQGIETKPAKASNTMTGPKHGEAKRERKNRRKSIPVYAAYQNGPESPNHGKQKLAKPAVGPQGALPVRHAAGAAGNVLLDAQQVVGAEDAKDGQHDDLQHDAGNDGAVPVPQELLVILAGGGSDAAADALDDEARQVGGEEDARVPAGREAGQRGREVEGDVLEGEVDGDADEGRGEDDGADLELEGAAVPGVGVEQDAANVACSVPGVSTDTDRAGQIVKKKRSGQV